MRSGRDKVRAETQYNIILREHDVLSIFLVHLESFCFHLTRMMSETVKYLISEACGFVTTDHHGEPPVVSLRG